MQHFPFACSSCDHEFNTVRHSVISQHYEMAHDSFLCMFCSSVIDPYSMSPEHFEKKHNVSVKSHPAFENPILFELIGDRVDGLFHCKLCDKRKPISQMFGHYCHYHNLSIQSLKSFLDSTGLGIRINGSCINGAVDLFESVGEVCNVCEKQINADSSIHEVFCQGLIACEQKECDMLFQDKAAMESHLKEHPISACRFGCNETKLKLTNIREHELLLHGIQECALCDLINSSGNMKNHLREKHNVQLDIYEKNITQSTSRLFRLSTKGKLVFCIFCDNDITTLIRDFSFINHYQNEHEIKIPAILRNLDQNPIIDIVINDRKSRNEEDCLKNFTVIMEKSTEELVVFDFDCSKVFCVAADVHSEQKPRLVGLDASNSNSLECEFCNENSFDASCRLYEHLNESHGFKLLNVGDGCSVCPTASYTVLQPSKLENEEDKKTFNLSLVCPIDSTLHLTKENFHNHVWAEHNEGKNATQFAKDIIIYKCFECNFAYKHLNEMRRHFSEAHPELILTYCKLCRYKLTSPSEKSQHFSLNHADEIKSVEKLSCKLCKKDFNKKSKARIHYETAHKKDFLKKSFKCLFQVCNEAFENKEDRKMHQMASDHQVSYWMYL